MERIEYRALGERLFRTKLPNGLEIQVVPKPGYAKTFAMFAADYGGADRSFITEGGRVDVPAGVAHFLEHKLFDMPEGPDASVLLAAGGASPNAYTSDDITAYHFECTDSFEDNLRILLKFVSTPHFTAQSVQKEQGIIGQEISMEADDPDYLLYYGLFRSLYEHSALRDSILGTVESIGGITPETLYLCHRSFYRPSNMILCVVGDVDARRIEAIAAEETGGDIGPAPEKLRGGAESPFPAEKSFTMETEVSAPRFLLGGKVKRAADGQSLLRQSIAGSAALDALLGRSSPLYASLYAQGLVSRDFSASLDYACDSATILIGGESRDCEKTARLIMDAAGAAAESGFDSAYFERLRRANYGSALCNLDSFESLCDGICWGYFRGYGRFDRFDVINSVTAAEARDFIAEYLTEERLSLATITPKG